MSAPGRDVLDGFRFDEEVGYACTLPPTGPYSSWIQDLVSVTPEP